MVHSAYHQVAWLLAIVLSLGLGTLVSCSHSGASEAGVVRVRPALLSRLYAMKDKQLVLSVKGTDSATWGRIVSINEEAGVLTFNLAAPDNEKQLLWYIDLNAITAVREAH